MNIIVHYDASVNNAPQAFKDDVNAVVAILNQTYRAPITININVGYGEVGGQTLADGNTGQSFIPNAALNTYSYSAIYKALDADSFFSANAASAFASLPSDGSDPLGGTYLLSSAQAKALGVYHGSVTTDGYVGFSNTDPFDYNRADGITTGQYDFTGDVYHEITEILDRKIYMGTVGGNNDTVLDLFNYKSPNTRASNAAGYFSIDGGVTDLADFNNSAGGDAGDWGSGSAQKLNFVAISVNDKGQILGNYQDTAGTHWVLDDNGVITPENNYFPNSINDLGQMVGTYGRNPGSTGYLFSNGAYTDLTPPPGAIDWQGTGISNNGLIVGWFETNETDGNFASYDFSTHTVLDPPDALEGKVHRVFATGINDAGVVVGYYYGSGGLDGFIYNPALANPWQTVAYSRPGNSYATYVEGINDYGQIVGWIDDLNNTKQGFVYTNGQFQLTSWGVMNNAINDLGQIAGLGYGDVNAGFVTGRQYDAFMAFFSSGVENDFSQTDQTVMDVLGYNSEHSTLANDFNRDGCGDIVVQGLSGTPSYGTIVYANMANGTFSGWGTVANVPGYLVVGTGAVEGNGYADVVIQQTGGGQIVSVDMINGTRAGFSNVANVPGYSAVGVGDINGDGYADVVIEGNSSNQILYGQMGTNGSVIKWIIVGSEVPGFTVKGVGDINGDGYADIVIQSTGGQVVYANMANGTFAGWVNVKNVPGYNVVGVGDVNGDGYADVVVQNSAGQIIYADMANGIFNNWGYIANTPGWVAKAVEDCNGDGFWDVVIQNSANGQILYVNMLQEVLNQKQEFDGGNLYAPGYSAYNNGPANSTDPTQGGTMFDPTMPDIASVSSYFSTGWQPDLASIPDPTGPLNGGAALGPNAANPNSLAGNFSAPGTSDKSPPVTMFDPGTPSLTNGVRMVDPGPPPGFASPVNMFDPGPPGFAGPIRMFDPGPINPSDGGTSVSGNWIGGTPNFLAASNPTYGFFHG